MRPLAYALPRVTNRAYAQSGRHAGLPLPCISITLTLAVRGAAASPAPAAARALRLALHNRDFLWGEVVELVDELVNLAVGGVNLALGHGFFVRRMRCC